jgi:hypothetical protein
MNKAARTRTAAEPYYHRMQKAGAASGWPDANVEDRPEQSPWSALRPEQLKSGSKRTYLESQIGMGASEYSASRAARKQEGGIGRERWECIESDESNERRELATSIMNLRSRNLDINK